MPPDSRVTQSFPLKEEERDEPYRLSAERANSMEGRRHRQNFGDFP
jgi:hypothetical protein